MPPGLPGSAARPRPARPRHKSTCGWPPPGAGTDAKAHRKKHGARDDTCQATSQTSCRRAASVHRSLLLAAGSGLLLPLAGDHLAKHHDTVAVHEGDAGQALAVLESVTHQRLLRLEGTLRHLVRLQRVRLLHLLAASLLAHLPQELRDAAGRPAAAHEADGRVADLDLVRDVEHLNLRVELPRLPQRRVLLVDHDIASPGHVVLVEVLDVEANVVAGVREVDARVVHLHSEDLAGAGVGGRVRWQEDHLLARPHDALLDAACEHVADTLDLVDARDGHPHRRAAGPLRHAGYLVEEVVERIDMDGPARDQGIAAAPPRHVVGLLQEVVAHPAGDRQARSALLNEVFLPADLLQHVLHLVGDLLVAVFLVAGDVAVHLVDADADLLHTQQVDEPRVLARLALDLPRLVVALGDRCREVAVGGDHDERDIRLRGARDHVLDKVAMPRSIDNRIMPLLCVELLRGARDCHAALALLLLPVHVEGKGEGGLSEALRLGLQLLQLALRDAAKLEEQPPGRGALATVHMPADHDGEVLLLGTGFPRTGHPARQRRVAGRAAWEDPRGQS